MVDFLLKKTVPNKHPIARRLSEILCVSCEVRALCVTCLFNAGAVRNSVWYTGPCCNDTVLYCLQYTNRNWTRMNWRGACRPIPQIPRCIRQIPRNAPFCNRNVTKRCLVGYGTGALWDMCNRSIIRGDLRSTSVGEWFGMFQVTHHASTHCRLVTIYGARDCVAIGSDCGLLSDSTKSLPKPVLNYHQLDLWKQKF